LLRTTPICRFPSSTKSCWRNQKWTTGEWRNMCVEKTGQEI